MSKENNERRRFWPFLIVAAIIVASISALSGALTGSGVSNAVVVWINSTALGNSSINDNGTLVNITQITAIAKGGAQNRVVCWKNDTQTLGWCSSVVATNGSCICN